MAGRVLCIELGTALTKVCEMDYGKANPSVYDAFMFETPDGTIEDGYIKSTEAFSNAIKKELASKNISTNKVIFTVYSNKIATREASIPLVKNDKILSVIQANASDYFPIDLTGYQLGFTVLDKVNTKEEKSMKLSVVAAPKDLLESYLALSHAMNMTLVDIDFAGNSIFQAVKDTSSTVQVSIHMNEFSTLISVIDDGKMMMQRSIAYGVFGAIDAIKGLPEFNVRSNFTTMDAIDVLTKSRYIDSEFSQGSTYSAGMGNNEGGQAGSNKIVTDSLRYLVGNVARVIDYYVSKNPDATIGELKLTGLGSQFQGIDDLFANEIGIKTRQIIAIPSVSFERVGMGSSLSVMLMAIGANLAPMGLVPEEVAKQKAATEKKGSFIVGLIIMILCFIGCIFLMLFGVGKKLAKDSEYEKKSIAESSKEYITEVVAKYSELKTMHDQFVEFYNISSHNNNEKLNAFIGELEQKMPESIVTGQVYASNTDIELVLTVESKEEAAHVLKQLREFKSIYVAEVSTPELAATFIQESATDENGETIGTKESESGVKVTDENGSEVESVADPLYKLGENCVALDILCTYNTNQTGTTAASEVEPSGSESVTTGEAK